MLNQTQLDQICAFTRKYLEDTVEQDVRLILWSVVPLSWRQSWRGQNHEPGQDHLA
jgi:hypothetical protein